MPTPKVLTQELRDQIAGLQAKHDSFDDAFYLEYLACAGADDFSDFDESYQGAFADDEEFAQSMAHDIGAYDMRKSYAWPFDNIDWRGAAHDLMHDYFEIDGHYFRHM